jgi:Protein of unknown function (DUF2971)
LSKHRAKNRRKQEPLRASNASNVPNQEQSDKLILEDNTSKPASQAHSQTDANTTATESRSLFHYTTAQGLVGIIQHQSLFATHSEFLNDATECRLILDILLPKMEAQLKGVVPTLVARKLMHPSILTDFGDTIYRQEAERMLNAMIVATNTTAPYFIASFCIHEPNTNAYDHGLLSQWRGYGRSGFAIEFDELGIDDLNKAEAKQFRYQGIITERVSYREHEKRVSDDRFTGFAGALLKNLFPNISDRLSEILGSKKTEDFAHPFLSTAPFLKDASFEEENEYRIVALCNRPTIYEEIRPPR